MPHVAAIVMHSSERSSDLSRFIVSRDEHGQGLAEYALILAFIAVVAILAVTFLGTQISQILSAVGAAI